ncbi:MAG: DNA primase DnaG [Candidatus Diapherotrites archaeon]
MAKTYVDAVKYMIRIQFQIKGIVDKPDIVGAVFGQSEGLLGEEMDLRELQKMGRVGRIEVNAHPDGGSTKGDLLVPTSMDMAETSVLAAAIETVDKVGPCESKFVVKSIEDVRKDKRAEIAKRAKELLSRLKDDNTPEIDTLTEEIRSEVRVGNMVDYGHDKLSAGPAIDSSDEVIVVEGRADVGNLLRHGIKNVIGMGGSRISQDIVNLSKRKTIVLFVDGDRGGELNARKLHQIANVAFVAVAPDGKEVEELQQKEIIQSLRRRVPVNEFLDSIGVSSRESNHGHSNHDVISRPRFDNGRVPYHPSLNARRGFDSPARGDFPSGERFPSPLRGRPSSHFHGRNPMPIRKRFGTVRPLPGDSVIESPDRIPSFTMQERLPSFVAPSLKENAVQSEQVEGATALREWLEKVKGKRMAAFLDKNQKELASVPVREMVDKLKETKHVNTIVCDGIITKRLVDAAAKCDVQTVVGVKRGKIGDTTVKTVVFP